MPSVFMSFSFTHYLFLLDPHWDQLWRAIKQPTSEQERMQSLTESIKEMSRSMVYESPDESCDEDIDSISINEEAADESLLS